MVFLHPWQPDAICEFLGLQLHVEGSLSIRVKSVLGEVDIWWLVSEIQVRAVRSKTHILENIVPKKDRIFSNVPRFLGILFP